MNNSPVCGRSHRSYAPRSPKKGRRVGVSLSAPLLAEAERCADKEQISVAGYVLTVYLEGQAARRNNKAANGSLEAK